ncbi:MAG TPA: universal stress protein [Vicinamibacterales bacterium]|nr:universal stress protein [Vicinamibacterales bacterium]
MTTAWPSLLCPIDFSEPSRSALCYAAAIADHFGARLTVLSVDDPLLAEVATSSGQATSLADATLQELKRFCRETLSACETGPKRVEFKVRTGKPATEILREATESHAELIVMSSHGRSGMRKMFFGSTTERVLRETSVPVFIAPDAKPPVASLSAIASHINRVLTPVDLTPASAHQLTVAAGLAEALSVPLIVTHVLEPLFVPYSVRLILPGAEAARRVDAEEKVSRITATIRSRVKVEPIVVTGDPSEEIITLAEARQAKMIVMGLHSSGILGPRMGSVTYRVLCRTQALVLALPPTPTPANRAHDHIASAIVTG